MNYAEPKDMEAVYPSMSAFIHLANTSSLSAMCRTMCYPPGDAEMTGLMRRSGWAGQRKASSLETGTN